MEPWSCAGEFWNGLDDDIRVEVKKALDEAIAFGNQVAAEKANSDKQAIIDSKRSEVLEISDAERAQWVTAMKPVWNQFSDEIGAELIEAAEQSNN